MEETWEEWRLEDRVEYFEVVRTDGVVCAMTLVGKGKHSGLVCRAHGSASPTDSETESSGALARTSIRLEALAAVGLAE